MKIRAEETMAVNGRLKQVGLSFRGSVKHRFAVFMCECGQRVIVQRDKVNSGHTRSCGCLHPQATSAAKTKHGHSSSAGRPSSREYNSWAAMKQRCENPQHPDFHYWGGRGIVICERWRESFESFLEDMGKRPEGTTLDRMDNNGNYEPYNCRWATWSQQRINSRRKRKQ